ncbi:MAG: hypothetical protein RLZZ224_2121, partial [Verrucomicrobiota bacterium]
MKKSALRRYYHFLWEVRGTFAGGILAGLVYGLASGMGLPTMVKYVFPLLFQDQEGISQIPSWLLDLLQ